LSILAVSPSSLNPVLLAVDIDGFACLVNLTTGTIIARLNFHSTAVSSAVFSPDGSLLAVAVDKKLLVFLTPSSSTNFQFLPLKTFVGHAASITHLSFPLSSSLLSSANDGSVRLWDLSPTPNHVVFTDQIHAVVGAFLFPGSQGRDLFTLSRTAFLVHYTRDAGDSGAWTVAAKAQLRLPDGQTAQSAVTGVAFELGTMVVGFSSGVFALYELPSLSALQCFSLSLAAVPRSLVLGGAAEWVGLGLANGSVAVYEWKSESFVLRTGALPQGGVACVACAPSRARRTEGSGAGVVAVGGWNGEVRLYEEQSGFNFATFKQHTAAVTCVVFAAGDVVLSGSLDGSIRAYDVRKLRNFRTFTRTAGSGEGGWKYVAVDGAGEVVAGASGTGGTDMGGIWLWSMKTGQVLERLAGHESVITGLGFLNSGGGELVSTSLTDRSVRVWKYMEGGAPETTVLARDAVAMSVASEGGEVAIATVAGKIMLYGDGKVNMEIDCGRDIVNGRTSDSTIASSKHRGNRKISADGVRRGTSGVSGVTSYFVSLAWVGGSSWIAAVAKESPFVYLYEAKSGLLVQRLKISGNRAIDGILSFLNSKKDTRGALDGLAVDNFDGLSGLERKKRRIAEEAALPGVRSGVAAGAKTSWQAWQVASSPDGSSLAVATSEGAFVFHSEHTQRDKLLFRPAVIDADVNLRRIDELFSLYEQDTTQTVHLAQALATSLALNHLDSIYTAIGKIPISAIPQYLSTCVAGELLEPLVFFLATSLQPGSSCPHVELLLLWADSLLTNHWRDIQLLCSKSSTIVAGMQTLMLALNSLTNHLGGVLKKNAATLQFLADNSCFAPNTP
jgi:periodic tryptophan protein 2